MMEALREYLRRTWAKKMGTMFSRKNALYLSCDWDSKYISSTESRMSESSPVEKTIRFMGVSAVKTAHEETG